MRGRRWVISVVALIGMLLSGCAPIAPAPTAPPPTLTAKAEATPAPKASPVSPTPTARPVKVKFATQGFVSDAGLFIALEKGYFKEQGIEAEWQPIARGPDLFPPLATGELQLAGGAIDAALFSAIQRGINLRMVADKSNNPKGTRFAALVVRKDLADQIKEPADLKGRSIALLGENQQSDYALDRWLKKANLTLADVKLVILPNPADHLPAFASKAIDVAWMVEPFITLAAGQGLGVPWLWLSDLEPDNQSSVVVFGEGFVKDVDAARRFMVGYIKGVRDYNDVFFKGKDKAEVVQILAKYTSLKDPPMYDKVGMSGLHPDGKINVASVEGLQGFLVGKGALKEKVDLNKVVDMQFADYAVQKLGPYR